MIIVPAQEPDPEELLTMDSATRIAWSGLRSWFADKGAFDYVGATAFPCCFAESGTRVLIATGTVETLRGELTRRYGRRMPAAPAPGGYDAEALVRLAEEWDDAYRFGYADGETDPLRATHACGQVLSADDTTDLETIMFRHHERCSP